MFTVPSIVPMITGSSGVNISTIIVYWDPIPDDREHIKGRVGGYTVCIVYTLFIIFSPSMFDLNRKKLIDQYYTVKDE